MKPRWHLAAFQPAPRIEYRPPPNQGPFYVPRQAYHQRIFTAVCHSWQYFFSRKPSTPSLSFIVNPEFLQEQGMVLQTGRATRAHASYAPKIYSSCSFYPPASPWFNPFWPCTACKQWSNAPWLTPPPPTFSRGFVRTFVCKPSITSALYNFALRGYPIPDLLGTKWCIINMTMWHFLEKEQQNVLLCQSRCQHPALLQQQWFTVRHRHWIGLGVSPSFHEGCRL